jgi:hypothetical protein
VPASATVMVSNEGSAKDGKYDLNAEVRELAAEETHALRRAVSADGRADLPSMQYELDNAAGSWHLGAVDTMGRVLGAGRSVDLRSKAGASTALKAT